MALLRGGMLSGERWAAMKNALLFGWVTFSLLLTPAFAVDEAGSGIDEYANTGSYAPGAIMAENKRDRVSTTDHSKLKELQGPFASGPEVTKACLSCHTRAGEQFMHSLHWKWEYQHPTTRQVLGKKTLINNFCTNARGNEAMCSQCHASYNHTDSGFDYTRQENIDCVVCHDQTGLYYRTPANKGNKACSVMFEGKKPINWTKAAQGVGMPTRKNCGTCHFYGGGGDNVKHGDLSSALNAPTRDVDVHMARDGLNFSCQECHVTRKHITAGSRYQMQATDAEGAGKPGQRRHASSCESCHGNSPHVNAGFFKNIKLNGHTDKIACPTCHIPEFAKGGVATKTEWDWRDAGRTKNGEGFYLKGYTQANGVQRKTYKSIKGSFEFGENLSPEYHWFNGEMNYTTVDTQFESDRPIAINSFDGSHADPKSRIWPFKKMRTFQPYDQLNNTLVYMHLWGDDPDAYWGNYDFQKAIARGMSDFNKPYSGKFDFIETLSYWPITHMVAPKEQAMQCAQCHAKNGRLEKLAGFYMPGRDRWPWLDTIGYLAILGSLAIVLIHGSIRYVMCRRKVIESCKDKDEGNQNA
jgi:octaheme c-type cytochrome (tetrathionate reductase family)